STLAIRDMSASGRILEFPLSGEGHTRNLYIVYSKHRILKPHVKQLLRFLKEYYEQEETAPV
ncbi:MAG: LysR family transcriptional regulator, partial [Lachnospiraceae bacterium]